MAGVAGVAGVARVIETTEAAAEVGVAGETFPRVETGRRSLMTGSPGTHPVSGAIRAGSPIDATDEASGGPEGRPGRDHAADGGSEPMDAGATREPGGISGAAAPP